MNAAVADCRGNPLHLGVAAGRPVRLALRLSKARCAMEALPVAPDLIYDVQRCRS